MVFAIWIGLGALILGYVAFRVLAPSVDGLADKAAREGDLEPLLDAIRKKPESSQPTEYNHAIRRLWDGYHRELAIELLRDLAKNYGTARITQYWLKQVQQVEPQLTLDKLGKEFLETYYLPDLAAQCGPVG